MADWVRERGQERHAGLDAVVVAVDRLAQLAVDRGAPSAATDAARQFLEYKLCAVVEQTTRLRAVLKEDFIITPGPTRQGLPALPQVSTRRGQILDLYLLLDGWLFAAGSVREALLQLVNVTFQCGFAADDTRIRQKIAAVLGVGKTSRTGLERWVYPSGSRYKWLDELETLRNTTTHRSVISMGAMMDHRDGVWSATPAIRVRPTLFEDIENWIPRAEERLCRLTAHSVRQLATTLRRRSRSPSLGPPVNDLHPPTGSASV